MTELVRIIIAQVVPDEVRTIITIIIAIQEVLSSARTQLRQEAASAEVAVVIVGRLEVLYPVQVVAAVVADNQ